MKIALAQMRMTGNVQENLEKSLKFCDLAEDCDLLFSRRSVVPVFSAI